MGFFSKLFGYFSTFEDSHPGAKLAAAFGQAVVSHIHGGGSIDVVEAVIAGIQDVIKAHKAADPAPTTTTPASAQ